MEAVFVFVYSFKASSVKMIGIVALCVLLAAAVIVLMPEAGSALNVNKFDSSVALSKIEANTEQGRLEYLSSLGFEVQKNNPMSETSVVPKAFDKTYESYNNLQRSQGFDLTKYSGKKVKSYTYKVSSLPDGTKLADDEYLATLIIYKDKVIGADLCCKQKGEVFPLVTA